MMGTGRERNAVSRMLTRVESEMSGLADGGIVRHQQRLLLRAELRGFCCGCNL